MNLSSSTILVTGGASGIGLALVERFLKEGSKVIICGRREDRLKEVKTKYPQIEYLPCDIAQEADRIKLFQWATSKFSHINMLVNNAGIQQRLDLTQNQPWSQTSKEIAINLEAPVHLSTLFIPHLLKQQAPAIVNVTSGLSFVPLSFAPIYCATKAALHSFTLSLRHQLSKTPIKVIEIIPPAVNTDLGGVGLHTFGVPLDEFADSVMARFIKGDLEIPYGMSEGLNKAAHESFDKRFLQMNQ
jgi:uncharacterized oxidoreductase